MRGVRDVSIATGEERTGTYTMVEVKSWQTASIAVLLLYEVTLVAVVVEDVTGEAAIREKSAEVEGEKDGRRKKCSNEPGGWSEGSAGLLTIPARLKSTRPAEEVAVRSDDAATGAESARTLESIRVLAGEGIGFGGSG